MTSPQPRKRIRTSKRPIRHQRVVNKAPAYITRKIPNYEIVSEEGLVQIEQTADRILAETGIEFRGDEEAIRLWKNAGAEVTGERVCFPPGLVREILLSAPEEFTQHARNPERSIKIGGKHVVMAPSYGSPFIMDADEGRRYSTLDDFNNLVKLAYSTPWLHHSGGTICEPVDIPVNKRHLDMVYAHMRYSDKAYLGSITSSDRAEDSIQLSRILFGPEFVKNNCVVMGNVNVNSPLVWDGVTTEVIRTYAAANQGMLITPFILGGAMGPVTSAGAIAQALAETMVGCALTQLVRPGAPVIFGNFMSSMSLRSGSPTFGTPEPALASLAIGQLARRLKLPLRCSGSFSTSKVADGQALRESTVSMMTAIQCGANFIMHSAGFLDGLLSMSYEKFMMDTDFCGALHTYLGGIDINQNTLAEDAINEVGPGNHFLGCTHTMSNYQTAFWESELADNDPYEQWLENGSKDINQRANQRWKKQLEDYQGPPMEEDTNEALCDYIARKKSEQKDAWY